MRTPTPRKYRSPEVWEKVKAAYLAGEPASSVCRRFDVGVANLRRRAGTEGWTRAEAATKNPGVEAATVPVVAAIDPPTYYITTDAALRRVASRAAWLAAEGRAAEATALVRAGKELARLVHSYGLDREIGVVGVEGW